MSDHHECVCDTGQARCEAGTHRNEVFCKICGHPLLWHGDRAVTACDGGWGLGINRAWNRQNGSGALCSCPGWSE